ncbi:META domain-containing protein [Pedobacter sp. N36a]|uniref:META domain-containing protein n=1 Tax=Pedobacter sp. N36a TaxID=2767996 RepID=UPI0016573D29|nr:META domain-containing protein [Pedobacter sp. N36a]MBC8984783.1 META domain-containing protein [Pedobacter sp. N36a]
MLKSIITKKGILSLLIVFGSVMSAMAADVITLMVKEDRASCTGVAPMNCLQVKYKNSKNWELFYSEIQGFKHQEGYRYTLSVIRTKRKNVPADASAYTYKLKKVIKKEKIMVKPFDTKDPLLTAANQKWTLSRINGRAVNSDRVFIRLDEKGNKFNGSGGCNSIFGSFNYVPKTKSLSIGKVASTMMACSDEKVNKLESEFTQALSDQTYRLETSGNTLTFYKGKLKALAFRTEANSNNDIWSYIGKNRWKLIQMEGVTQDNSPVTISFNLAERRFSGNSGCNNYFGNYNAGSTTIAFGPAASTRRACMDKDLNELERKYLSILGSKNFKFDVADQTLNLYQNDRLVLMFGVTK